jgi:hypothetical protein
LFVLFAAEFCLSDLCAVLISAIFNIAFWLCDLPLVVLVISSGCIHNLLEMVFLLWFCFVCYCMQTVSSTTVVLSCFDFYWCSVLSMFWHLIHLFALFICLWVICCQHLLIYSEFCCEHFLKLACEQFVFVSDKLLW